MLSDCLGRTVKTLCPNRELGIYREAMAKGKQMMPNIYNCNVGKGSARFWRDCANSLIFAQTPTMELVELFEKAVADSKSLSEKPSNETLLQLYSLYKQATEGDNTSDPPSNPFDFVAKAKYEAWSDQTGKSKDQAMKEYVDLVNKLKS